jgi:hypothetical protein
MQIIRREQMDGRFKDVNKTNWVRKGGGCVFKVEKRELDGTTTVHDTQEAIEAVAGQTICDRYRLAYSAPIMRNPQLLHDVWFTGDGPAINQILRGSYEFPPDTDQYTKLLMLEAAIMYTSLGEDEIVDFVQRLDFQGYWRNAREKTESSKSKLHFGHYVAGSHDNIVSDLHATSLNVIREVGVGPTRWRSAVTVLLEKVLGIRLIDKLRAICLLEADFNWLNKLMFTHRLEQYCRKHNIIPAEQFAKSKSSCEEATLVKNCVCDTARILHNSFSLGGADLDQCFDRSNAPIAGLAARAHHLSAATTRLMLTTMQHMQYFVKTGFGIAKTPSFGGSTGDLLMSLGQGSDAAPMGMRNIITLADNAYKRLGHGINMESSISARIFLLAAIIYVDDTDLLHWAKFYGISDEEFVQSIQTATTDWRDARSGHRGRTQAQQKLLVPSVMEIRPRYTYNQTRLSLQPSPATHSAARWFPSKNRPPRQRAHCQNPGGMVKPAK